jgi:hypothetical protein
MRHLLHCKFNIQFCICIVYELRFITISVTEIVNSKNSKPQIYNLGCKPLGHHNLKQDIVMWQNQTT